MPSAFINSVRSYPAVPLAGQLAHQRYVPLNPLVLERKPRKFPSPTADRDRPRADRGRDATDECEGRRHDRGEHRARACAPVRPDDPTRNLAPVEAGG